MKQMKTTILSGNGANCVKPRPGLAWFASPTALLALTSSLFLGAPQQANAASMFPQSVASGDPTPSSVVLWTRIEPASPTTNDVPVSLEVATDPAFGSLVQQQTNLLARGAFDHCLKVQVGGLSPYTTYYYRFNYAGQASTVGRTKTAPALNQAAPVRFAVINCQDYIGRYYNTLAHLVQSESNQVDFVVHLGDYIYETTGDPSFQSTGAVRSISFTDTNGAIRLGPTNAPYYAAASLDNYRQLYRTYRSDANLQRLHELFPVINIWDDHEYANDCWGATSTYSDGRQNEFNPSRRHNAEQAFFEYLPIAAGFDGQGTQVDASILYPNAHIARNFQFGSLLQLFMTDYRSFRPDHLIAEDAFPGAVPMTEATCSNLLGGAWNFMRASFDAYANLDDLTNAVVKATAAAIVTGAYQAEGLSLAEAQARAVTNAAGNVSTTYLNGLFQAVGQPAPFPNVAGLPRGLSLVLLGKQGLFNQYGSRYLVPRDTFQLYAAYRGLLDPNSQNAYGTAQTAALSSALTASTAKWKVVGDSVSFTPLGFDFAHPVVPLPTNFPAQLRVNLQLNADDWDGFPNARQSMLDMFAGANAVVISGDIHASFITKHNTSLGRIVPEFTGASVSSESFREEVEAAALGNPATAGLPGIHELVAATDLLVADALNRSGAGTIVGSRTDANGYFVLQATPDHLIADYRHIPASYVETDYTTNSAMLNQICDSKLYAVTQGTNGLQLAPVEVKIKVGSNIYTRFSTGLTNGAWAYLDADPAAKSPLRATQRSLGYREVEYKAAVYPTLSFSTVTPATNGSAVTYDYSAQSAKTATVGFWAAKDLPIIVGPDGNGYITDGHHTSAGYLAPISPVRQFVPGLNRVVLGHIVANYYDPLAGPQSLTDSWWQARASENNAYLYGTNGSSLVQPGEPNYGGLQPILPSVLAMPTTPSRLTTNGAIAMLSSPYRGLTWGLADGILMSAWDNTGKKIGGYKKAAPGSSVDINFVEFYWADFLRNRIVWNDAKTGSPYGSTNGDGNLISAPLSFFAAVANGTAFARSEVYRDQYGRKLTDYTNSALFNPNTVNWANGSYSNGLAVTTDTYHLYLLDDSTVAGDIAPSARSTNILHINTTAGLSVTNNLLNLRTLLINDGPQLATSWKDSTVPNSTLRFPAGTGVVELPGNVSVAGNTIVNNGALMVDGVLSSSLVTVAGGSLDGIGTVNGAVSVLPGGTLSPGASMAALTINGPLTLAGNTIMEVNKVGPSRISDLIWGLTTLRYGGGLTVLATGNALTLGDTFKLFDATNYTGAFASYQLPALGAGLAWNTARLLVDGTIVVGTDGASPPVIPTLPANVVVNVGSTAVLTGGAVGSDPISYQWLFEGAPLTDFTNRATLMLSNVQLASQGNYWLVAQNSAGKATNGPTFLTVNQVPSVALTSPANGATFVAPANFNLMAAASDLGGFITRVDFYRASTKLGTVTNTPFTLALSNQPLGALTFTAIATDNQGIMATSAPVKITVLKNSSSPTLALQILHASDLEASLDAVVDAPAFSSVLAALRGQYPTNTVILSSGDNYIPGPFFNAAGDAAAGFNGVAGRGDIAMLNAMGFQAAAFGNHEFDAGTSQVNSLLGADNAVGYPGTVFPYLSANLDFSPDSSLRNRVVADGQNASGLANKIAKSCVISVAGQLIGIVGATTPYLRSISSPGNVGVNTNIVATVQAAVDALLPLGVNKIIVLAHLQQYQNEFALAQQLRDVDVVIAGGSHAVFATPTDHLRTGDFASTNYPVWFNSAGGEPVAVVNCGPNYRYVGRFIINFGTNGLATTYEPSSGAYATDAQGLANTGNLPPNPTVLSIATNLGTIINVKDGALFGRTTVYLNGLRQYVRTEESNLGDLTADANLWRGKQSDATTSISLKNGGGIRDSIGAVLGYGGGAVYVPPLANPSVGKQAGQVSQLDIENSLRFNNGLSLITLTAQQLRDAMEWGVAAVTPGATPGQFPQVGGLWFSYNPTNSRMTYTMSGTTVTGIATPGSRLQNLVAARGDGSLDLVVENGALVGDPTRTFRMVTLGFLADGGDSYYPLTLGTNRLNLAPTTGNTFPVDGGEQWALAGYLTNIQVYAQADTAAAQDQRIQNTALRTDTVTWPLLTRLVPGAGVTVYFTSLPGRHYEVWATTELGGGWTKQTPTPIAGTGFLLNYTDASPSPARKFYQIRRTD